MSETNGVSVVESVEVEREPLTDDAPEAVQDDAPAVSGPNPDIYLERFKRHVQAAASGILSAGWDGIDYVRARLANSDSALREAAIRDLTFAAQLAYDDRVVTTGTINHWLRYAATVELFAGKRKMPTGKGKKRPTAYRMAVEFAVAVERSPEDRGEVYAITAEYEGAARALWGEMLDKGLTAAECQAALRKIMGKPEPEQKAAVQDDAPAAVVPTEGAPADTEVVAITGPTVEPSAVASQGTNILASVADMVKAATAKDAAEMALAFVLDHPEPDAVLAEMFGLIADPANDFGAAVRNAAVHAVLSLKRVQGAVVEAGAEPTAEAA